MAQRGEDGTFWPSIFEERRGALNVPPVANSLDGAFAKMSIFANGPWGYSSLVEDFATFISYLFWYEFIHLLFEL